MQAWPGRIIFPPQECSKCPENAPKSGAKCVGRYGIDMSGTTYQFVYLASLQGSEQSLYDFHILLMTLLVEVWSMYSVYSVCEATGFAFKS